MDELARIIEILRQMREELEDDLRRMEEADESRMVRNRSQGGIVA